MKYQENGRSCTKRSFVICTHSKISLGRLSEGEQGWWDMWHAWERKVYKVLVGIPKEKIPLRSSRHRWEDVI
jgi:hypothetical protein